jgi:NAD(P)-dependent dehydrogenase (short-subunit alcohol dehydrogenase family)
MDLELTGKVVVVTGASKGIGLAIAQELAAEGALVVAGARNVDTLQGIEGVTPVAIDLAAPDGPSRLIAEAIERHGRVDVLVNNVGAVRPHLDGFLSLTDADFEAALQLNFFAALRATRAAVADMAPRREGTIVNVGSVNAFFHPDGAVIDYGAAKAALLNLSKALSQELGPQGIRITSVAPGPVATDLWLGEGGVADVIGSATGAGADAIRDQATAGMPTGRFTTPREVATIVTLLASPRTANVTGADWLIDGGLIKTT